MPTDIGIDHRPIGEWWENARTAPFISCRRSILHEVNGDMKRPGPRATPMSVGMTRHAQKVWIAPVGTTSPTSAPSAMVIPAADCGGT